MRPIDRTLQALGQVQTITERAVRDRRMHPQVLRDILTVIGDTLRGLREDPPEEAESLELQRRLDLLLALIDPETRARALAEEQAAGRTAEWLAPDEVEEREPAEPPSTVADASDKPPPEPAPEDDPEAHG